VVDAVRCAIEVQNGLIERDAGLPPERRIEFRVGIYLCSKSGPRGPNALSIQEAYTLSVSDEFLLGSETISARGAGPENAETFCNDRVRLSLARLAEAAPAAAGAPLE
jgi:hypothetical protein